MQLPSWLNDPKIQWIAACVNLQKQVYTMRSGDSNLPVKAG